MRLLQFFVQGVQLCMDFQYLERVLPLPMLEPVPSGPDYVAGLMNLQGRAIPIIDLALRLGMNREQPYSLNAPILLCSGAGLIIDKILEISEGEVQMKEELGNSLFLGSVPLEAGVSLLINTQRIVEFKYD